MIIEKNIMIAMPDGIKLATDIYRPETEEGVPALIARTPYNKNGMEQNREIPRFVAAGYAVVVQDVRGRYASEGEFIPYEYETDDALCLYEWIRAQSWNNGKFGTFGGSYLGGTQWLPARRSPEGHCAMIPEITFDDLFTGCMYQGGAKVLHDLRWTVQDIIPDLVRRAKEAGLVPEDIELASADNTFYALPMASHPTTMRFGDFYQEWLKHNTADAYWAERSPNSGYEGVTVPALNISGWYDIFVPSTLNNFTEMQKRGGSAVSCENARLIMSPWSHMNFSGTFPEHSYGEGASGEAIDLTQIKIDWYNHWIKGMPRKDDSSKPVKIFIMGENVWRNEAAWPLPDTKYKNLYLHSGGSANTLNGDGYLSWDAPAKETADSYVFDPMDPTPTVGGQIILPPPNHAGPRDQRMVEARCDVLVFDSPVLTEALEVTGNLSAKLYVSSDCVDTDITAKLVDVFPDGRAMLLTDGILRLRYRDSLKETKLMEPGKIYEITVDMCATANVFLPGHKLRLEVASCNFPKFNRNSNTGGSIAFEKAEDYRPAKNTIYHDASHKSHLILPVIER